MGTGQAAFEFKTWGGRRKGAGRPPKGERPGVSHARRPELSARHPVHVTMKTVAEVGRLRTHRAYKAVRRAMASSIGMWSEIPPFRICHVSIQADHLHLVIEADDRTALSSGMQRFASSCAKELNAEIGRRGAPGPRRGRVFVERYHSVILTSPRQVRAALAYVVNNWRKHREDVGSKLRLDPFSSAIAIPDWTTDRLVPLSSDTALLPVWFPRTWLLAEGWRVAGAISPWERPGTRERD